MALETSDISGSSICTMSSNFDRDPGASESVESASGCTEASESEASGDTGVPDGIRSALAFVDGVLAAIREPLLILDAELRVRTANEAYVALFRVSRKDVVNEPFFAIGNGQWEIPGLRTLLEGVRDGTGEIYNLEVVRSFKGIGSCTLVLNARRLVDVDGDSPCVLFLVDDVTDRKRTRALVENERRFREVIDALPIAIYTTDADGRITHANPASVALTGRSPAPDDQDRGRVGWKLFHADGTPLPPDRCPMAAALKEGVIVHGGEYIVERPDGTRRWFSAFPTPIRDADGNVVGGINMLMDITERMEAEELRREEDLRYRTLVEHMKDYAIFRTDTLGVAMTWNEGVRRLFGFEEAEFIGRDVAHLIFLPEDVQLGVPQLELDQAAAIGQVSNDRWMRRRDGSRFYAMGVTSAIRDSDGNLVGYTKVKRDQTHQKQLEDELRRSSNELSEADRRKNEFLATLAHELRNPLAPIQNALNVMRMTNASALESSVSPTMLERQVSHMVRLVDDLLDVSRISRGTISLRNERSDLSSIVRLACDTAAVQIESSNQTLAVSMTDEPISIIGDPIRLAQVVGNLLNNASKFTEAGGTISLSLACEDERAVLRIRDSGIGMEPERIPLVFELFTQLDTSLERSAGGLGIGLALVKSLVEQHGGTVEARSEGIGLGSEFIVRLPIAEGIEAAAVLSGSETATDAPRARRFLIADDNLDSAESLSILLQLHGHETHTVGDGLEAVEAAERLKPDVVVLDIGMPRMNGFDACRSIRAQPWGKPMLFVAVSGWGQEEDRRLSREAGFNAHFVKPLDHSVLLKLLEDSEDTNSSGAE